MKTKQISKLFAVMAIAAPPAAANPAAPENPWTVSPVTPGNRPQAMAIVMSRGAAARARAHQTSAPAARLPSPPVAPVLAVVARPRTTPSGAPACGNVASRAPRECSPRSTVPVIADTPAPVPHLATVSAASGAK